MAPINTQNIFSLIVGILLLTLFALPVRAQVFETQSERALLYDVSTGSVMFSKNADDAFPPASFAKLMTMEVVFHALEQGELTLDDEFTVSENAWRTGGAPSGTSTMFAALGSSIRLEDLIKGVVVHLANDGCIIIAEGMVGSEEGFAQLMNERAAEIGLENSTFVNATGLPADGQAVTLRDLVTLTLHMQSQYPEYYAYYGMEAFEWNRIFQRNRNPLLPLNIGADGLITGFAEESGYGIVGSTNQNGRRIVLAMSGLPSASERADEAQEMLVWGQTAFSLFDLFGGSGIAGRVSVYGGDQATVPVELAGALQLMLPTRVGESDYTARIVYNAPIVAPIEKGQNIAMLELSIDGERVYETPLVAAEDVGTGAIHRQAWHAFVELATGWIPEWPL